MISLSMISMILTWNIRKFTLDCAFSSQVKVYISESVITRNTKVNTYVQTQGFLVNHKTHRYTHTAQKLDWISNRNYPDKLLVSERHTDVSM